MSEYYLTDSEFEILSLQAKQIIDAVDFHQPFNIIELGAGDGFKTFKLFSCFKASEATCSTRAVNCLAFNMSFFLF